MVFKFPKTAWIIHIHTVLEGFASPCETRYADFVWVYGTAHLKNRAEYTKPVLDHYFSLKKSAAQHIEIITSESVCAVKPLTSFLKQRIHYVTYWNIAGSWRHYVVMYSVYIK